MPADLLYLSSLPTPGICGSLSSPPLLNFSSAVLHEVIRHLTTVGGPFPARPARRPLVIVAVGLVEAVPDPSLLSSGAGRWVIDSDTNGPAERLCTVLTGRHVTLLPGRLLQVNVLQTSWTYLRFRIDL